jgi:FKBP-type peptidyl-prolyl cis-trans isomerase
MKKTYILLALVCVALLSSCGTTDTENTEETTIVEATTVETNTTNTTELTGNVVVEIPNTHQLAGKTLIFDVEAVAITAKGSGATLEDTIEIGDSIEVHYVGTLEDGEQFDSSRDREQTLPFTVGAGQMIAGFDAGVVGMKIGETKIMTLSPEEAYGPSSIIETIPMAELQSFIDAGIEMEVGAKLPTQIGDLTILEIQN